MMKWMQCFFMRELDMPTPNLATGSPMLLLNHVQDTSPTLRNWDLFLKEVNESIDALNKSIERYNATSDLEDKKTILREIYEGYKQIVKKHPDKYITASLEYENEIHKKLFYQLKEQFSQLGVSSLYDNAVYERQLAPTHSPLEIFGKMAPEKISDVLEILSAPAPFSFESLAKLYNPSDAEYPGFQAFLSAYDISVLGGNNSKNYKITPTPARKKLTGEEPCVLKIEYRMGMPKFLEAEIRDKLSPSRLTPLMFERQGTTTVPFVGDEITKTLVITDFCSGGDLMQHSALQTTSEDKIQSALTIYKQMAEILIQLQDNNCFFVDMKNTNWLIDEKNFIQVADTKGFLPTRSDGVLDRDSQESRWFGFISTIYMNPPEFSNSRAFVANDAHAYMLGKNLYHYLTGDDSVYSAGHNASFYNFNYPVFLTSLLGKRMERLIKDLVKPMDHPSASKRKSVAYALKTLNEIELSFKEILDLRMECQRVLDEIKTVYLNKWSPDKELWYQTSKLGIENETDINQLMNFKAEVDEQLTKVKVEAIKKDCRNLLEQINNFNFSLTNLGHKKYLEDKKNLIQTENDLALLVKIKEELVVNVGKAQEVQKLREENNEIINKIRAYGFRGNDTLDAFLLTRETALAFGEIRSLALEKMKSELTTAQIKATIVFDLKRECYGLIDEIGKLGNLTNDPELQANIIKIHAKVDCIFDSNQLKQYKVGLEKLLTQEKDKLLKDEMQEPTAPSPGLSK